MTVEERFLNFLKKSKKIHLDKYDYSKVEYINSSTKIKIICPSHGEFSQTPHNHLIQKNGCPICKESKGERKISTLLKKYNIEYEREYIFDNCKNINKLPFDFYLPDHNICKEYDVFMEVKLWNYGTRKNTQIQLIFL